MASPANAVNARPDVSVLITVYNGGAYLEPALRSLMAQTLSNIEIIVVDDASTDGTPDTLARLAREDRRLLVIRLETNLKQPGASNRGLEVVRAPLVARLDADDLAAPHRLEVQKRYMDAHPGTVLVGASTREIDKDGRLIRTAVRPLHGYGTRWLARFVSPIVHSTYMFRARLPSGGAPRYDPHYAVGQDYDLLARMLAEGEVVSLPDVLVDFRLHGSSVSAKNRTRQRKGSRFIGQRQLERDLPEAVIEGLAPLRDAIYDEVPPDAAAMFAGLRQMVAYDATRAPEERTWVHRRSASLARYAMHRCRWSRGEVWKAFLGPGRDFGADFALQALEFRDLLPASLRAGPKVEDRPASLGSVPT